MMRNIIYIALFAAIVTGSYGQADDYLYRREVKDVSELWHKLVLPDAIFGKINSRQTDMRIICIGDIGDTTEVPFLLRINKEKSIQEEVQFDIINQSHNANGYFYTFRVPADRDINRVLTEFRRNNFDWLVTLEGSHNQVEWFTILHNYRIVSISGNNAEYTFTSLIFPISRYRYLRLTIPSHHNPGLKNPVAFFHSTSEGISRNYDSEIIRIENDMMKKQSIIDLKLELKVPVSSLEMGVKDTLDYYRPVQILYFTDSIYHGDKWLHRYAYLTGGYLSSLEEPVFKFGNTITERLRIIVTNHDNQPLEFENFIIKGNTYELVGRFAKQGKYFLLYGNKNSVAPIYDIEKFVNQIPPELKELTLGDELPAISREKSEIRQFLENKLWLWLILGLIILVLGWITIKMIRNG